MIKVTAESLNKVCDQISQDRCRQLAEIMNKKIAQYGITDWDQFHEFVGQVAHESGEFSLKSEDMSYSAQRLAEVWPDTFSSTHRKPYSPNGLAAMYAHKPVQLANFKYGGKYGNRPGTNSGWDFRGGGYIGITFYDNWKMYADYKKMEPLACAEWVRTTDEGAMDSAFWFFYVFRHLGQLAIDDNDKEITRRINGGFINYNDRIKYTERARKYLN